MRQPLAIDLCCGLGGWTSGLLAEGWNVVGIDIEEHIYGEHRYPAALIIQDVLTVSGSAFSEASLIVASPPCQFFSYTAMPWSRAKALAAEVRSDPARLEKELALFNACFRIQGEACLAAGRHIPMVVENVRGTIPWVGRSRWNFGSFHLWGDIPALMPATIGREGHKVEGFRFDGSGKSFQSASVAKVAEGRKGAGVKPGGDWFAEARKGGSGGTSSSFGSKSPARKFASAMIAKIPEPLSRHVARTFRPIAEANE